MTFQDPRKSSLPKPSGIPKPTKGSLDQVQTPEVSRNSSIPIRKRATPQGALRSPLRPLRPDTDEDSRLKEDQDSISPAAASPAARNRQYGSKSLPKAKDGYQGRIPRVPSGVKAPNHQQQSFKIATRDASVRAKEEVNREPSTPEQHHPNTPVSLDNLGESQFKDRHKASLSQTKSSLPVLEVASGAVVANPEDCSPISTVETESTTDATYQSTCTSTQASEYDMNTQENVTNEPQTPCSEITSLIYSLEHFPFFCLLDPKSPENPISCASQFPWPSTQLREKLDQFYLKALGQGGKVCEIIADTSSEGDEKSYLVLFDKFLTVVKGSRDYSLACVVDVTSFVNAAVPGERKHELQAVNEATLGNDDLKSSKRPLVPVHASFNDKLTKTLQNDGDARRKLSVARLERRSRRLKHYLVKNAQEDYAPGDLVGRTVDEFTKRILEFYTDYFMLARSSSDDEYYQMTHVSDSIHRKKEYIDGHLTHSSHEVFMQVKKALGRDERFTIRVQWGHSPAEKRLYCVPLIDPGTQGWVCLLVDSNAPLLWQTSYRGYYG